MGWMGVRQDCRHYLLRTASSGEAIRRCRLEANETDGCGRFACPDGCLFYETRNVAGPGWAQAPAEPMSNTAANLPDPPSRRSRGKGRRRR
jgi:hypothetical protein